MSSEDGTGYFKSENSLPSDLKSTGADVCRPVESGEPLGHIFSALPAASGKIFLIFSRLGESPL
jgi:hypothetical protein